MNTEQAATAVNVQRGMGSKANGEPQGSVNANGEPIKGDASAKGEPSGEGLFDGMTPEQLHRSYKSLQAEFTKEKGISKKFEQFGGADQVLQWTEYLARNPDFAAWITAQKTKNALGIDESTLDENSRAALDTVRKIARSVMEDEVNRIRRTEIAPLTEAAKQSALESHFAKMDREYGDEWHEMRDLMSELSESLPDIVLDNPTFEDMEDLYFKALRKANKLEAYAGKKLQKQIDTKKGKATDKPGATGETAPKPANSIKEAFEQAKQAAT